VRCGDCGNMIASSELLAWWFTSVDELDGLLMPRLSRRVTATLDAPPPLPPSPSTPPRPPDDSNHGPDRPGPLAATTGRMAW
jgi:hypothetical protein